MNESQRQLIRLYLSNLQVSVTAMGFNQVWTDWRDLNYIPDYNKFYLICSGEGWLKIGDTEFTPKPGEWFLMPQGVQQSYSYTEGPRYIKYWCHFTAQIGPTNLFDLIKTPFHIDTDGNPEPVLLFQELLACQSSEALASPLLANAAMLKLIAYYIEQAVSEMTDVQQVEDPGPMQHVIEYINTYYCRNITVSDLAERAFLHPNYFIRLFKQHFGVSPIQFVNQKRIEEAKLLLLTTNLHLANIGDRIGISDVSYLSKLFKAQTGFSPTAYRMAHRPD